MAYANMNQMERCANSCTSTEHGNMISSALTVEGVTDSDLCIYASYVCQYCGTSLDSNRRSALSVAASCGRSNVCRWLICKKRCNPNQSDVLTGLTPLHHSIYFGQIHTAVTLVRLDADVHSKDWNTTTPVDIAIEDNITPQVGVTIYDPAISNAFGWGKNANYTLGVTTKNIENPQIMAFHKEFSDSICQVELGKYHAFLLTNEGQVYAYGNGQGGKLGLKTDQIILEPTKVNMRKAILQISTQRDFTLFLTKYDRGMYSCGSNKHFTLGLENNPSEVYEPQSLPAIKDRLMGICTSRYHCISWGYKCMFSWGLNRGQLGHDKDAGEYIKSQTKTSSFTLPQNHEITSVATTYNATAVGTSRGNVYLLQNFLCRRIANRNYPIHCLSMYGGTMPEVSDEIDHQKPEEMQLTFTNERGELFYWSDKNSVFASASYSIKKPIKVRRAKLHKNGLIIVTEGREVYHAKIEFHYSGRRNMEQESLTKSGFSENVCYNSTEVFRCHLERVPKLYNPVDVFCDFDGENFAACEVRQQVCMLAAPAVSPSTIKQELEEALKKGGDFTIKVGYRTFTADKFILARGSKKFRYLIEKKKLESLAFDTMHPDIFDKILTYLYTNSCDFIECGTKVEQKYFDYCKEYNEKKDEKRKTAKDPLDVLREAAKEAGVISLLKDLKHFEVDSRPCIETQLDKFRYKKNIFKRDELMLTPDYCIIEVKGNDGKSVLAHKSVLEIRSEYFRNILSMRWENSSKKSISLEYPCETIDEMIKYLYLDNITLEKVHADKIWSILYLANEILLQRLLEICEVELAKRLNAKNTMKFVQLAHIHNAKQLQICCNEMICLNLAYYLDTNQLVDLDNEMLGEITKFYIDWNKKISKRNIEMVAEVPTPEQILRVVRKEVIPMDFPDIVVKAPKVQQSRTHRRPQRYFRAMHTSADDFGSDMGFLDPILSIRREMAEDPIMRLPFFRRPMMLSREDRGNDLKFSLLRSGNFPELGMGRPSTSPKSSADKLKFSRPSQRERKRMSSESSNSSASESPKNPWNLPEPSSLAISPPAHISTIIFEEKKYKENVHKIMTKPLINTQIEDKAMEELSRFYNAHDISDEIISVHRVENVTLPTPLWIKPSP